MADRRSAVLDRLVARGLPLVQAPMAGGPGTPALAAAVSGAGGLGFLAAGYLTPDHLRADVAALRDRTDAPFGINVFWPSAPLTDLAPVHAYAERLAPLAERAGVALGDPTTPEHDAECLAAAVEARPAVISVAFGCPDAATVGEVHRAGAELWVTVTDGDEAAAAARVGADVLVAQGAEAGGHRGSFADHDDPPVPLVDLVPVVAGAGVPVVAAGGLADGADVAAVLALGATAAQLGTAFLLAAEAGTSPVHRRAVARDGPTTLTRAFSGRRARGIANAWTDRVGDEAPSAYPAVHHLTAPLRAHGRSVDDADLVNLWAGTAHARARAVPAAEIVRTLAAELDAIAGTGPR